MNGERRKKYKPRQCPISDKDLEKIAKDMSYKDCTLAEVRRIVNKYGYNCEPLTVLNYLESHDYLLSQDEKKTPHGSKFFYRVMTAEIYRKIEEEHSENAKRRLLAAISY